MEHCSALSVMAFHLICNEAGGWRVVSLGFAVGVSGFIAMGW